MNVSSIEIDNISITNYTSNESTVSFCYNRLNPSSIDAIIKNNSEGLSKPSLTKDLEKGNYISVLSAVWGEKDKIRRLTWLRLNAELHAPLMYELAIAEFVNNPTLETITKITFPLLKAATFRVTQDASCSDDSTVSHGDAHLCMDGTYRDALGKAVKKYAKDITPAIFAAKTKEAQSEVQQKICEIARQTLENLDKLPNPTWIGYHGLDVHINGYPTMCPPAQFAARRQNAAENILARLGP